MTFRLIDLASISVPTLVVVGEEDTESIFASAEQLQHTIPDVRATVIPDASHTVSKDNPASMTSCGAFSLNSTTGPPGTVPSRDNVPYFNS